MKVSTSKSILTEPQIRTISDEKEKRIPYGSGLHLELRPLRQEAQASTGSNARTTRWVGPMVNLHSPNVEKRSWPALLEGCMERTSSAQGLIASRKERPPTQKTRREGLDPLTTSSPKTLRVRSAPPKGQLI